MCARLCWGRHSRILWYGVAGGSLLVFLALLRSGVKLQYGIISSLTFLVLSALVLVLSPKHRPHRAPKLTCTCGIYAAASYADALRFLQQYDEKNDGRLVIGKVSLWGCVIQHENGYRAEYAFPQNLYLVHGTREIKQQIRHTYAVDVAIGLPIAHEP